ncbi:MAG TPA: hypothetical protein VHD81_03475 [Mycobacteriales bacterium]|nr:hypothetical protein [Mycobacteriales bacterium]
MIEAEDLRAVAEFAALAPSVHNTQPWRFVETRHSLEIHLDAARGLDFLDPTRRQMFISCGAATEFARLGVRSLGKACTVRLMPDASEADLVARLVVGFPEPPTPAEQRMIDAVPRRYTDRGPYTDESVSGLQLSLIRDAAGERHCWLRVVEQSDDRLAVIRLLETAEAAEASDGGYRQEIAEWQRRERAHDGIPVDRGADWASQHRVSDVPLRDFNGCGAHPRPGALDPPQVERDTIVVLGTDRDDSLSWLRAGRALASVLLVLTDADLVSQPLGPALDLPFARAQLRRELGLLGYPQMMLRIGHGRRAPVTGRREVEEVFTAATAP